MLRKILKQMIVIILANSIMGTTTTNDIEILKYFQQPGAHLKWHNRKETDQRILDLTYPCEKHDVVTEDGYIITIFHIPYSLKNDNKNIARPKVLLQHGLLSTSDIWIINGPDNSLPFMLADQGYDVWLGNSRGNLYGRKHKNLTTFDSKFWRLSWHEIGYYDLAAMIDYILNYQPGQEALHYIGHSQGCTALMVLLSLRPEYEKKIKTTNLLAPAITFENTEDRLVKVLAPYLGEVNLISKGFSSQEFIPFNELFNLLSYNCCKKDSPFQNFCSSIAFMLEGASKYRNESALQILIETHPGGMSTDQIIHFMQIYQSSQFRQFDFGESTNQLIYNQSQPPGYPLENIHQSLHIWYGLGDRMSNWKDVLKFAAIIPNRHLHQIPDELWSHNDFMFSMHSRVYVNEPILKILKDYEEN